MTMDSYDELSVYYQNTRGINTKLSKVYEGLLTNNYDIVLFTETWLSPSVSNSEFVDNNYIIFRQDRKSKRGGGSLVALKNSFSATPLNINIPDIEVVCVKIYLSTCTLLLINVYIPPDSKLQTYLDFFASVEELLDEHGGYVTIVGDFNVRMITGTSFDLALGNRYTVSLQHFITGSNLRSMNDIANKNGKTLDLILTNIPHNINVQESTCPIVPVDPHHPPLYFDIPVTFVKNRVRNTPCTLHDYHKANFLGLYYDLENVDWSPLTKLNDPNDAVQYFYSVCNSVISNNVPVKKRGAKRAYPVWFTKEIIKNLKLKEFFRKRKNKSEYNQFKYKELRKVVKKQIAKEYKKYVQNTEMSIHHNIASFWNFIKYKKRPEERPGIMILDGKNLSTNHDIANGFKDYFQSIFRATSKNDENNSSTMLTSHNLIIAQITDTEYLCSVKKLKSSRTSGPDGIPQYIYKACSDLFRFPLCYIYNRILSTSIFPELWKCSKVTPILKTGDSSNIKNYRPISIISTPAKIFEQILYQRIFYHVKPYLTDSQHGFISGRSTTTNLLSFSRNVADSLIRGKSIDVAYLDFAKAFDRLDHSVLLLKLDSFGFSSDLLKLMSSYLDQRKQYVVYKHATSTSYLATSGVPQGSNLGPLLFLIFINDITNFISFSKCLLYADDLKLFREISNLEDANLLQMDIDNCAKWSKLNNLPFNSSKCSIMTYSNKNDYTLHVYSFNGVHIQRVFEVRDLGILFDGKLTFKKHIDTIIMNSYRALGFVKRCTREMCSVKAISLLYNSLVRSKLEYISVLWTPNYQYQIEAIEGIQKKFLRYLYFKVHKKSAIAERVSYSNLLEEFSFVSLKFRRNFAEHIFLFKLLNGIIDAPDLLHSVAFNVNSRILRVRLPFTVKKYNNSYHRIFVLNRICTLHNQAIASGIHIDFTMSLVNYKRALTAL